MNRTLLFTLIYLASPACAQPKERNYPYRELEGVVEEFHFTRNWRSYYWREDFTLQVRDDAGKLHRVISREPTPWSGHRLGTTYTGLAVDWTRKPRVRIIGVQAIDRQPEDFYDVKLDPAATMTAFILRVQTSDEKWRDFFVNNWFHRWGEETDRKMLPHYANDDPNYTIYGYFTGIRAPFDAEGKKLVEKYPDANIYHARVVPAKNEVGYELRLIHLLGRDKKTSRYGPFYGDPATLIKLDGNAPPEAMKKK
jgi:hypothetical protein